jgi:hypothetical protein
VNSVEYMTPAEAEKMMTAYRFLVSANINIPRLSNSRPLTYTLRALRRTNALSYNTSLLCPLPSGVVGFHVCCTSGFRLFLLVYPQKEFLYNFAPSNLLVIGFTSTVEIRSEYQIPSIIV